MPDWTKSMQQTYEYYIVDPDSWKDVRMITTVQSCSISRDSTSETLGSASFTIDESLGEVYVRVYLVTIQNGIRERFPLGTYLVQTNSPSFNGMATSMSCTAYSPLIELKDAMPPIGYSCLKNDNVLDCAYNFAKDYCRAPVAKAPSTKKFFSDFVADPSENSLSYLRNLLSYVDYNLQLDELGQLMFSPSQELDALQPVWEFKDDENSILQSTISMTNDIYGIPNVVEVVYSNGDDYYHTRVVNDDPNSPVSTVNRGREIIYRETSPSLVGNSTGPQIQEYAEILLNNLSTLSCTISYTHGYCPVRVGDCVRIHCGAISADPIKAQVTSQSINCEPGCTVSETAAYTVKLWKGKTI